ncbi:MAG: hypothetical protein GXO77_06960 [Calditrichaeota bacterium]|nr:hypothetical protein [Calditrichota bacterium]
MAQNQSDFQIVNGFGKIISGAEMDYHSPHPKATRALITRATDGTMKIEWRSAEIKQSLNGKSVRLVWLAGLGSNMGEKQFTLGIENQPFLSFKTWNKENWRVEGKDGVNLSFRGLMTDQYGDRFGIMELNVPSKIIGSKKSLKLSVTGEKAESQAWVMTFCYALKNDVDVLLEPAIIRKDNDLVQPARLFVTYLGRKTEAQIQIADQKAFNKNISYGIQGIEFSLPETKSEKSIKIKVKIGSNIYQTEIVQKPVRKWTLYLVQHTHTDIGYTRPQQEILAEHLRYIDYALDYCDLTDDYPDEAKFRWTCEASWTVREYLKNRPQKQIERLKKRVKEGRIELTGMMFNMAEIADENLLTGMLQPVKLIREKGFPVLTAMQDDVNGFAWALVDYLSEIGIKYVTMGENSHRALKPFKHPTPFWWESPSGKRVLAFRADHYMSANFVSNPSGDLQAVATELFKYLNGLEESGYPYNRISVQYSGYFTDNSPPSTFSSDIIARWNKKYVFPKLRNATIHEFMQYTEREHGKELPVYRAAWPDWWTDGFGSAARETAVARKTQSELIAAQGLMSMARLAGSQIPQAMFDKLNKIQEQLLFYDEHTFGAAESISDPLAENTIVQWMNKASFVWQAQRETYLLQQKASGLLMPYLQRKERPVIYVFNTLNRLRSGSVVLYIDREILPEDRSFRLIDENGNEVPAQIVSSRAEGNFWALFVKDVPPMGWQSIEITRIDQSRTKAKAVAEPLILENNYYKLIVDEKKGIVKSLYDKELKIELADDNAPWGMGQFVYERLSDRHFMEVYQLGDYSRETLSDVRIEKGEDGSLWRSVIIKGKSPAAVEGFPVKCELRLFKNEKRIDLIYSIRKKRVEEPEAIYIAFPFRSERGKIFFEAQGGIVSPGENQLPGTASDWNTVQNFAAVRNDRYQIVLTSAEVPLMQFGNINTGRYQYTAKPEKPHIYGWLLNNYWTTNFRAAQEGDLVWRFSLTSSKDRSDAFAAFFGWNNRIPMPTIILPEGINKERLPLNTFSFIDNNNVVMASSRPLENSSEILILLREVNGQNVKIRIPETFSCYASDVLGKRGEKLKSIELKPLEARFFRLEPKREN